MQIYLAGLPGLMSHLKGLRKAQRKAPPLGWKGPVVEHRVAADGVHALTRETVHGPTGSIGRNRGGDLYTTRLPDYKEPGDGQPVPPPPPAKKGTAF